MTNKEQVKKILSVLSLLLGVLSLIMIFTPMIKVELAGMSENINGYEVVFGKTTEGIGMLKFSFGAFMTFILAFGGGLLAFFGAKNDEKWQKILAIICFLIAAILFFCTVKISVIDSEIFQTDLDDKELQSAIDIFKGLMKNGAGAILGGIFCILGVITSTAEAFLDKIIK